MFDIVRQREIVIRKKIHMLKCMKYSKRASGHFVVSHGNECACVVVTVVTLGKFCETKHVGDGKNT